MLFWNLWSFCLFLLLRDQNFNLICFLLVFCFVLFCFFNRDRLTNKNRRSDWQFANHKNGRKRHETSDHASGATIDEQIRQVHHTQGGKLYGKSHGKSHGNYKPRGKSHRKRDSIALSSSSTSNVNENAGTSDNDRHHDHEFGDDGDSKEDETVTVTTSGNIGNDSNNGNRDHDDNGGNGGNGDNDREERKIGVLDEARETTAKMEKESMERGLNMQNENISHAQSKMDSKSNFGNANIGNVNVDEFLPKYLPPKERDNIDTISGLTREEAANYIHSHQLLYGRYLTKSGKVEVATHRMFKLKPNFNKFDLLFDCVLKSESETVAETQMERELIKSSFVSETVRKFIGISVFGASFGHSESSTTTRSSHSQSKDDLYNLYVISSSDFIRGKFVLTKKCVDFTDEFIQDKNTLFAKTIRNEKEKQKQFDKFNRKYGDFYITQALIGGKLFIENETAMHSKQEYNMSKSTRSESESINIGFDGTMLGTAIGTAIGAYYGKPEMGEALGKEIGQSIQLQAGMSSASASGSMFSNYSKSLNKAISRSLQCIGGDPSQATYVNMNQWENSLWNHKRWEVIDVKSVNSWHDWLDLKGYEESYIPPTNRNAVIDGDINDKIFDNKECSITICQYGGKFGYLCSKGDNLVIRNDTVVTKFKFVKASYNDFYRIYVSEEDRIKKSKFIRVLKKWLKINIDKDKEGLLVTEEGSVANAGLFRMKKIGKGEYRAQFVKLEGSDGSNKMDMKYIGIDKNYKGTGDPMLACVDDKLFAQDLSVVFELNYTADDELKLDKNSTYSFESSQSKQKYLSNNFSIDKYGKPTFGFLSEDDSKFQLNSVQVPSMMNGESLKNIFEIVEVYDSYKTGNNYLAIDNTTTSQNKPMVRFFNEKNDKQLLQHKKNREHYCYWRIVELPIGGQYKIQHFGSEKWLAYDINSGNKYELIGENDDSHKNVIIFVIKPHGDGNNSNGGSKNIENKTFPAPSMTLMNSNRKIKVKQDSFSRSMHPVAFYLRHLNKKLESVVDKFKYSIDKSEFKISLSLEEQEIEGWFQVEVQNGGKKERIRSGTEKMKIKPIPKTFRAPVLEQVKPNNPREYKLYKQIYFKIKLDNELLQYNQNKINLLRDCQLSMKISKGSNYMCGTNHILTNTVLSSLESNDAEKVKGSFGKYLFKIDYLLPSTKYKLTGALYTRNGNTPVTNEFTAYVSTTKIPTRIVETDYHGKECSGGKWIRRDNQRIERIGFTQREHFAIDIGINDDSHDTVEKIDDNEVIYKVFTWYGSARYNLRNNKIIGIQFYIKNVVTGASRKTQVLGNQGKRGALPDAGALIRGMMLATTPELEKHEVSEGEKLVNIYIMKDNVNEVVGMKFQWEKQIL